MPTPSQSSAQINDPDLIKSLRAMKQGFVDKRSIRDDHLLRLKDATGLDVLMVQCARKALPYRTCTRKIPEATKRVTFAS